MTRVEVMSFDRPDPLAAPHATNESLTPEARNELLKMLETSFGALKVSGTGAHRRWNS
jgi:hypothetical protein